MKNKTIISIFSLIVFAAICFTTCDMGNPIMEKWWVEKEPKEEEPEYIPLLKILPGTYDTVIEEKIVYKTIFVQLPPEKIIEIVYVDRPVYEIVYEQLPPEIIYEVITETETITKYETVYETIIEYVDVPTPPTKETIIDWLKDPANEDDAKEIIREIKELIPVDVIKEIIKEIPPKDIIEYLTDEQIQYIVKQQPPQKILQSIKIIGIEYVIFAGDSSEYNGPPGPSANTPLTAEEKKYNDSTILAMAKLLNGDSTLIAMLHGHANPVTFTDGEKSDLMKLSTDRADAVRKELLAEYNKLPVNIDNPPFDDRVSTSGYGGEKVLFGNNTQYTALNRRVEMILFKIETTIEN
jgi:hypothetical protein